MPSFKQNKLIPALSMLLFSLPLFAQDNAKNHTENGRESTEKVSPLTEDELNTIKSNVDSATKLLRIAKYCTLPSEKQNSTASQLYAQALISSTAFIRPNEISTKFAQNLQEKVNKLVNEPDKDAQKCHFKTREEFVSFNQKINSNILTAIYSLISDEKTFLSDINNKSFADLTPEELLSKKFFSKNYEIYPRTNSLVLYGNKTRKSISQKLNTEEKMSFVEKEMPNFIFTIAGLQSLESCYKQIGLTEIEKNNIKPQLTKFVKEGINNKNIPRINRIYVLLTGAVIADTVDKNKCSYTLKSINFLEKFNTKLSSDK